MFKDWLNKLVREIVIEVDRPSLLKNLLNLLNSDLFYNELESHIKYHSSKILNKYKVDFEAIKAQVSIDQNNISRYMNNHRQTLTRLELDLVDIQTLKDKVEKLELESLASKLNKETKND